MTVYVDDSRIQARVALVGPAGLAELDQKCEENEWS